jgi:hypothetical protein
LPFRDEIFSGLLLSHFSIPAISGVEYFCGSGLISSSFALLAGLAIAVAMKRIVKKELRLFIKDRVKKLRLSTFVKILKISH